MMHHNLCCLLLVAGPALLPASIAHADPNIEYGESYETAYLAACTAHASRASCQCSMEVIEEAISFRNFAELVEIHGGDIRKAVPTALTGRLLRDRCGITDLAGSVETGTAAPKAHN
jgi:hypothetical protein